MNAELVSRRIRWTQLALMAGGSWLFGAACAEPTTVDPARVPEASADVRPESGDADPDADLDAPTGTGGTGGTGGSGGTGGFGAAGAGGARPDAADARDEEGDASADGVSDASADRPAQDGPLQDAPPADTSVPPEAAADVTRDAVSDPPPSDGARDTVSDVTADRDGGG
jgi:hypothetical protein